MQWYPAPAKLNLFLHVVGRRADGYHLLQTVFRLIDWCDRIGIEATRDGLIRRSGELPGVPQEADLCVRAARALKAVAQARRGETAQALGATLRVEKHLPLGGGLGGGSSDAATVLLVLNRLWALGLSRAELQTIALGLGADVPVFVFGENALGEGVGERLTALPLEPAWYLLIDPQVPVSTREIFADGALTRHTKEITIPPFFEGLGRNDLEPVVTARHPEVAAHLAWLKERCPEARMTGSGACVFARFDDEAGAAAVKAAMPESMQGWVVRGLTRHPLHDWAD